MADQQLETTAVAQVVATIPNGYKLVPVTAGNDATKEPCAFLRLSGCGLTFRLTGPKLPDGFYNLYAAPQDPVILAEDLRQSWAISLSGGGMNGSMEERLALVDRLVAAVWVSRALS